MNTTLLETFISVATLGSFSKVAEEQFISPPAVMKQINALEKELDVTLFVRTSKGLTLTDAGKVFLSDARYMLDYYKKSVERVREANEKENQKAIRIGTSVMTPAKFILDIWNEIKDKNNNLNIELIPFENTPENAREILKHLGEHIDIVAGIYDDNLKNERNFEVLSMPDKKLLLAMPISHPLSNKAELNVEDLKQTGVMLIREGWNERIDELRKNLLNQGIKVTPFDFFNLNAFNLAVKNNVPIIAIDGWENVHPLLKIMPVDWNATVAYGIMHSPTPSKDVKRFLKTVKSIVG